MTETLTAVPEVHDRITQAYFGEFGEDFMQATRKRIHWMCAQVRGGRVLDIGCSQGITAILLARDGFEVTGIDIDPHSIAEASDYLAAEPDAVQGRVCFVEGDAAALPVADPYDTVILGEILEHLEDPAALVAAAARHLAPGGRLVVSVPFGINNWPDHRQTFYLAGPHRLIAAHAAIDSIEILDRWIGFAATRPQDGAAPCPAPIGDDRLDLLEHGFQALERRLRDERATFRTRARAAGTRIAKLEAEAVARAAELTDVKRIAEQLCDEVATLRMEAEAHVVTAMARSDEIAALKATVETMRTQARPEQDAVKLRQQIRTLERRVKSLETSASFRLGHAIVRGVKAPIRLLKPSGSSRKPAHETTTTSSPLGPSETGDLQRIYADVGIDGVIAHVCAGKPDDVGATLAAAGKTLREAGHPEAEWPLLDEALRQDPTEATYRARYWAAHKADKLAVAWESLHEIEKLFGQNPSPAQVETLEKLRRSPASQLAMFEGVPAHAEAAPPPAFTPEPRRLCYVLHNSLPYSSGGYATRAHGMARGMAAAGLEVVCLTRPGYPYDLRAELEFAATPVEDVLDGIPYRRLSTPRRAHRPIFDYVSLSADTLTDAFKHLRPEWIMAASNHVTALPALTAARRLGIPFFYEVRGFWEITRLSREPDFASKSRFKVEAHIEGEVAKRADHVFTLTAPMRAELVRRGVPEAQITLLPNACDPERFTPRPRDAGLAARLDIPEDVPVIGYIGTFVQYEGLEDLTRACTRLRARGRVFRLMLVGNENASGQNRGPIMAEIARIAGETGLSDWLIMPGRVPHEEVETYYSLIDIAPFPRKPQPVTEMVSPMKPLEALAMEKAVVVSSVAALTEMVADGETGLVFEKGNVDSLADTLDRLIGDADLRGRLAGRGRNWVIQARTWDEIAKVAFARITDTSPPVREPRLATAE